MELDFKQLEQDMKDGFHYYEFDYLSPYMKEFLTSKVKEVEFPNLKSIYYTPLPELNNASSLEDYWNYCMFGSFSKEFMDKLYNNNWYAIASGASRYTFKHAHKNVVMKIFRNCTGIIDNIVEYNLWRNRKEYHSLSNVDRVPLAPCRLLKNGWLIMEHLHHNKKLESDFYGKHLSPRDGYQGGFDRKDRYKLFDYAQEHIIWTNYEGNEEIEYDDIHTGD